MTPKHVDFLRRLIVDGVAERKLTVMASFMATEEGIGRIKGNKVLFRPQDHDRARNLLMSRGLNIEAPQGSFTRSTAPAGSSEKTGALRVTEDLVAVVPMGLDQMQVPAGSMLAMRADAALALPYEVLLVCENMEPLLQLHTYAWLQDFTQGRPALALFRGAPGFFRTDVATALIRRDERPTLAFFDFDPKGLSMAASLPRREALCLPAWPQLQETTMANRRSNLFVQSVHEVRPHLDREGHHPAIAQAWQRLKELGLGLDQEHFPRT